MLAVLFFGFFIGSYLIFWLGKSKPLNQLTLMGGKGADLFETDHLRTKWHKKTGRRLTGIDPVLNKELNNMPFLRYTGC